MSIQAHPNLHAVKFLTHLAEAVLRDGRTPDEEELDYALKDSLRGQATMQTPIDWPGMKESLRLLLAEAPKLASLEGKQRGEDFRKRILTSFVHELSERLDYAVEHHVTEWQGMT